MGQVRINEGLNTDRNISLFVHLAMILNNVADSTWNIFTLNLIFIKILNYDSFFKMSGSM
jgi:hypothetical protein